MTQSFFVAGPLPGMNEMIKAAKSGRGKGNAYSRMKALFTAQVVHAAIAGRLARMHFAAISFKWREAHMRRDPDNVTAGAKFVLDGLVDAGILPGDGWGRVTGLAHTWDKAEIPGVWVQLDGEAA